MNAEVNVFPRDWNANSAIIKVIGVGGGGGNAAWYGHLKFKSTA